MPDRIAVAPLVNRTGDPSGDNLGLLAAEAIIQRFQETGAAETVALSPDPVAINGGNARISWHAIEPHFGGFYGGNTVAEV